MIIRAQIYKTHTDVRLITHGVFCGDTFLCFSRCFCGAMKAAKMMNFSD